MNNFILFSVFWGVGGTLEEESRKDFHTFILKMIYYEDVVKIYNLINLRPWEPNGIAYNLGEKVESLYDLVFDQQ